MNPYAIEFGFSVSQLRRFRTDSDRSMKARIDRKRERLGLLSTKLANPLLAITSLSILTQAIA